MRSVGMRVAWLLAMAFHLPGQAASTPRHPEPSSLEGDWLAPAEDADDVNAIITIEPSDAGWNGHIKSILVQDPHQAIQNGTKCQACPGPQQGQPYQGLQIIQGMRVAHGVWSSGHILDPSDGQLYQCEMSLSADARTLSVTAYKGLKLLGHTMVWQRP